MRKGWVLRAFGIFLLLAVGLTGCVPRGLVVEEYEPEFYQVPKLLPDSLATNPSFIVVGDIQHGFSAYENVYKRKNWMTWKQLLFPFYQLYLVGRGIGGAINYKRGFPDANEMERAMMRDVLLNEARITRSDFLVALGDISADDGRKPEHWASFLREYYHSHQLLREVPFLPTPGNHDFTSDSTYGLPNYQAVFDYPLFYVVDFPDGALFMMDSNYLVDQHQLIPDSLQNVVFETWFAAPKGSGRQSWLQRELAKRRDKPFKMLAMHHSPISFAHHSSNWTREDYGDDLAGKRARLIEVLRENGVQVVFGGHEHIYEHNVVRFEAPRSEDVQDMHFIVSSGGGATLREIATEEEVIGLQAAYEEGNIHVIPVLHRSVFHFTLVQVTPDRLTIQTWEVNDRRRPEPGDLIDQFVIERRETRPVAAGRD